MQAFQAGDRVKFRDSAKVPFRIRAAGARLIVREVSASGAVRIAFEHAGSVWVKGELLEPADDAADEKEGVVG
jgi:hypothetical protein